MDKCCDNCKNFYEAKGIDCWDSSKDYCSKWEEKDELVHFVGMMSNDPGLTKQQAEVVWNVFKQRIKDSLEKAKGIYVSEYDVLRHEESYVKAFDWIIESIVKEGE